MQSTLRAMVQTSVKGELRPFLKHYLEAVHQRRKEEERIVRRKDFAMTYYRPPLDLIEAWAPRHTEDSNFYYELTDLNRAHLAALISTLTNIAVADVVGVFRELDTDEMLRTHLVESAVELDLPGDVHFAYGRRLGWY